jgi:uncharacterized membrane protein YdbT with pleckstrin-like domain
MLRPKYVNHRAHMRAKLLKPTSAQRYNDSSMNPNAPHMNNPLQVMSPGEQVVCEIKRHPFGLIGLYVASGAFIVLLLGAALVVPAYVPSISANSKALLVVGGFLLAMLVLAYTWLAATIYNGNHWIVTSDSITQITQTGLFSKQTSQLSLANLEDVTFEQNSLLQTMFGFGLLRVETAGERAKFSFPFCPNPSNCAREIIKAHEDFIQAHPEEGQMTPPGGYNPQYQQQSQMQQQMQPGQTPQPPPGPSNNQSNDPTQQS